MLLWDDRGGVVASWSNGGWDTGHASEMTGDTLMVETATHWADINCPATASKDRKAKRIS